MMVRRDVLLKYRGSVLGVGWSFLYPLFLLAAFSLVSGSVIGARWATTGDNSVPISLAIYCGLIIFTPISEIMSGSPRLLLHYSSYVKKIVFPVEVLPITVVLSATVHAIINLLLLLAALALVHHLNITSIFLPLVLFPAFLLACGLAWTLAATGVFLRDLIHVMPVLSQILLFVTPVFYPRSVIATKWMWLYQLNPLNNMIENLRLILLAGKYPDWGALGVSYAIGLVAMLIGFAIFQRGRDEFADVL